MENIKHKKLHSWTRGVRHTRTGEAPIFALSSLFRQILSSAF